MVFKLLNQINNNNNNNTNDLSDDPIRLIIDMRKVFFHYSYSIVMRMIRNSIKCEEEEETKNSMAFLRIVEETSRVTMESLSNVVDLLPILRWVGLGSGMERKMRRVQEKRDKFMEKVVEEWQRQEEEEVEEEDGSSSRRQTKKDRKSVV